MLQVVYLLRDPRPSLFSAALSDGGQSSRWMEALHRAAVRTRGSTTWPRVGVCRLTFTVYGV